MLFFKERTAKINQLSLLPKVFSKIFKELVKTNVSTLFTRVLSIKSKSPHSLLVRLFDK